MFAPCTSAEATEVAITFACNCGKRLKAAGAAAGKPVKCPACGNVFQIPAGKLESDVYALADGPSLSPPRTRRWCPDCGRQLLRLEDTCSYCATTSSPRSRQCPHCHKLLERARVICARCGFDLAVVRDRNAPDQDGTPSRSLRVAPAEQGAPHRWRLIGHTAPVSAIAVLSDGERILSCGVTVKRTFVQARRRGVLSACDRGLAHGERDGGQERAKPT